MSFKPSGRFRTPNDVIANAARMGASGAICNAEVWNITVDAIGSDDPVETLENCAEEVQALLRQLYLDRPHSLPSPDHEKAVRDAIRLWCESA